jgi:DNA ligase-1
VLLSDVVVTSAAVARSAGRRAKISEIASLLAKAPPDEVTIAVAFLSGELTQRQIGVGYAALVDLPDPTENPGRVRPEGPRASEKPGDVQPGQAHVPAPAGPVLTLTETDAAFEAIGRLSGAGSQAQRRSMLGALLGRATESERQFLFRLLAGDLGQGALEGVMVDAVAQAAGVPAAEVRRAHQLCGSLPEVAQAALAAAPADRTPGGQAAESPAEAETDRQRTIAVLRAFTLRLGRPIRPMLAASAPSLDAAMSRISPAAVEWKIDGIRIQIHRDGAQVRVFTRTLEDITARVPEIVAIALALDASSAVVDGEAVALRADGRPRPFQVTSARVASQGGPGRPVEERGEQIALTAFLFDLLYMDGRSLIEEPASERFRRLAAITPAALLIPRLVTSDGQEAMEFFRDALGRGHEGVVVKSAEAPYRAGRRGSDWIKVKPRTTLDLVILAAEWGHGRRRGWLSNLHLGARDPVTGGFVMLGKTFKGLTDAMLAWQTERLLDLADPPADRGPATAAAPVQAGAATAPGQSPAAPGDAVSAAREQRGDYGVVRVRPELVAEIAFDGVQASRRYPGGVTLRFARVLRYRQDKRAEEADTIETVRALWPGEPAD